MEVAEFVPCEGHHFAYKYVMQEIIAAKLEQEERNAAALVLLHVSNCKPCLLPHPMSRSLPQKSNRIKEMRPWY